MTNDCAGSLELDDAVDDDDDESVLLVEPLSTGTVSCRTRSGGASTSAVPSVATGRSNGTPVSMSISVMLFVISVLSTITTALFGSKPGHESPRNVVAPRAGCGGSNGLPHAHFARGTPKLSTSTAVPASRTDCSGVACPLRKPWLVTRASVSSTTGVRPRM